jgi:hypothetical protein
MWYYESHMSFLYRKKTKKVMKYIWMVLAILIIISMVLLFTPGLIPGSGGASIF